jgi:hypothetical protein
VVGRRGQLAKLVPQQVPGREPLERVSAVRAAIEMLGQSGVLRLRQAVVEERDQSGLVAIVAEWSRYHG